MIRERFYLVKQYTDRLIVPWRIVVVDRDEKVAKRKLSDLSIIHGDIYELVQVER